MKQIEITKPDDWHVHFRDDEMLKAVVPETSRHFARAIVMPNLIPPILSENDAIQYKKRIMDAIPSKDNFVPLMTLYLTEKTNKTDLKRAFLNKSVLAAKLYPAGATTNSDSGVKDLSKIMHILEIMCEIEMPLLIHGEVTNNEVDIFDREKEFIEKKLNFICRELPELKITLEHITTSDAVNYINEANKNVVASITPHHLALNRNALLAGGIKPHNYCLPVLKGEYHRQALVKAAISGSSKYFLGTDSAPHLKEDKENACGCAGVFNATTCISILAEIFDRENAIEKLEDFVSINGAKHYGFNINKEKIKITKTKNPLSFQHSLNVKNEEVIIFQPDFPVFWETQI